MIEQVIDKDGNVFGAQVRSAKQDVEHLQSLGSFSGHEIVPGHQRYEIEAPDADLADLVHYRVVRDDWSVVCERLNHLVGQWFGAYELYRVAALPVLRFADIERGVRRQAKANWQAAAERILDAAVDVSDLAMNACGGAAFSKHLGIERIFRDARAGCVMAPTSDHLHEFIGRALTGLPLF